MIEQETYAAYKDRPGLNASTLLRGMKSLKALKHAIDHPDDEPTAAQRLGLVCHRLILEPRDFAARCVVMPSFKRHPDNVDAKGKPSTSANTSWVKEAKTKFHQDNVDKQIVDGDDYDTSLAILAAVNRHPTARGHIEHGLREVTVTGRLCHTDFKGRIDIVRTDPSGDVIVDLKSAADARPGLFGAAACRLFYPERMSIYRELYRQESGRDAGVQLIVAESADEHDVAVMEIPGSVLDHAFGKVTRLILEYENALKTGNWWGVDGGINLIPFTPPGWYMPQGELDWSEVDPSDA